MFLYALHCFLIEINCFCFELRAPSLSLSLSPKFVWPPWSCSAAILAQAVENLHSLTPSTSTYTLSTTTWTASLEWTAPLDAILRCRCRFRCLQRHHGAHERLTSLGPTIVLPTEHPYHISEEQDSQKEPDNKNQDNQKCLGGKRELTSWGKRSFDKMATESVKYVKQEGYVSNTGLKGSLTSLTEGLVHGNSWMEEAITI